MNNFDSRVNQTRITRPTQSGWYHVQSEVKGRRTPDGGNHYFIFGSSKSLCKNAIKDPSWKINGSGTRSVGIDEHDSICKDCLELYTAMKNKSTSHDDVLNSLIQPHHIHSQNCSVCGLKCIYLSNNKDHIHTDRIHVGCNGYVA